jgi:pimeloyl-ACP methyl ester carboxylesterase
MRVVFVHGAFVKDAVWWWHRMLEPLELMGLRSHAVELPSCAMASATSGADLYADADAVRAVLASGDEPAIVVAHSYGGIVATDAAAGLGGVVRHLVYLTSMMPEVGESLADIAGPEPAPYVIPGPDGTAAVRPDEMPALFLQDCDDASLIEGALRRLVPQSSACFRQGPRAAAWKTVPSTYVVCAQDGAIAAADQRRRGIRAGRMVELPTGHHPFLTQPALFAQVIAEATTSA